MAAGAGVSKPDDWFELLKGEFDQLYAEGEAGHPKMMCVPGDVIRFAAVTDALRTIAMHNRFVGKPGRLMALKRFMDYIAKKEDVWVCTREEIAAVWRERYPYEKVGATGPVSH